jgi:predicted flap endonuclease-1-like 5' DNA nuclease
MENYQQKLTNPIITWGTGLIIGILFGLIVLGWGIWPVQWVDAAPDNLLYDYQVDYMRTIIGTYGYDRDASTAQTRYYSIGENAETALAEVAQNPGTLPPELVMEFSQEVAGVQVEQLTTAPVEAPQSTSGLSVGLAILLALIFLALGGGLTYMILRGRKQAAPYETVEVEGIPGEAEGVAIEPEAVSGEEWQAETWQPEPVVVEPESTPMVEEPYLSDVETAATRSEALDLPPFLATAAVATAAGAIAGQEEEEAPEEPQVGEVEVSEEAQAETPEPVTDSPMGGEILVDAALAGAVISGLEGEEETVKAEEIPLEAEEVPVEVEEVPLEAEEVPVEEPAAEEEIEAPDFGAPSEEPVEGIEEQETEMEPPVSKGVNPHDPIEVKMRKKLDYIEGVGTVYSQKLADAGITTTGKLMVEAVTRKGRRELAEKTGISEKLILEWINHIDLYRIKGVGSEYADLLEAAGVDTVPELAQRNPDRLYQALVDTNLERRLVRQMPVLEQVTDWIEQAKVLPRIIQY